jgi:hypothetical protein
MQLGEKERVLGPPKKPQGRQLFGAFEPCFEPKWEANLLNLLYLLKIFQNERKRRVKTEVP